MQSHSPATPAMSQVPCTEPQSFRRSDATSIRLHRVLVVNDVRSMALLCWPVYKQNLWVRLAGRDALTEMYESSVWGTCIIDKRPASFRPTLPFAFAWEKGECGGVVRSQTKQTPAVDKPVNS